MRVEAYRNLNTGTWNLRQPGGNVIGFCTALVLKEPEAKLIQCERKRMVERNRRTVHLVLVGELVAVTGFVSKSGERLDEYQARAIHNHPCGMKRLTFNPWTMQGFQYKESGAPWTAGRYAQFCPDLSCWVQ